MNFNKEKLLVSFKDLPEIIEDYVKNIPEDILDVKRNEQTWTIREHINHIVDVQEMLYGRILKIKEEEKPIIIPYFPEDELAAAQKYSTLAIAFEKYKEMREKQIALIRRLTEEDFQKEAKHGEYINYSIPIILNHMIFHEYWHMYRIEEIWLTKEEFFS